MQTPWSSPGDGFGPAILPRLVVISMRTVVAVVALVAACMPVCGLCSQQYAPPDFDGQLASVSYAPFEGSQSRQGDRRPRADPRRSETAAPYTRAIRTYSSTGGVELVPGIAAEFGLQVTVGVWLDKHEAQRTRNPSYRSRQRHTTSTASSSATKRCYAREKAVDELIKIIQRVKRQSKVPVTTGEIWTRLARPSRAGVRGRLYRRAHPALLGRLRRSAGGRSQPSSSTTNCAAPIPASAS